MTTVLMLWLRYVATLPLLLVMLGYALAESARSAWRADPLRAAGMMVAPDQFTPVGRSRNIQVNLVALQPGLSLYGRVVLVSPPGGRAFLRQTCDEGFAGESVVASEREGVRNVEFRLSPESGFGRLRTFGRVFSLDPKAPTVAVDLEPTRSSGRYQLQPARRRWLNNLLAGRQVVYLADVELDSYNELRARLELSGWPAGPLVMSGRQTYGRGVSRKEVARDLRNRLNVALAVVGEPADNQQVFDSPGRAALPCVAWPGGKD